MRNRKTNHLCPLDPLQKLLSKGFPNRDILISYVNHIAFHIFHLTQSNDIRAVNPNELILRKELLQLV
jgi:hypothetical protein